MTRTTRWLPLVALALLAGVAPAHGQSGDREQNDRALYLDLAARVRQIDRDYDRTLEQAMRQARAGDGQADLELQARLLALQESRDRTLSRLILVASRHGWEVPDFDQEAEADKRKAEERSPVETVFAPAARIVQGRFAVEAREIIKALRLPVIALPGPSGAL